MEQNYLSDDIFEQLKDSNYFWLSKERELLIDKLILNKELKERCKKYGLCNECKQPKTGKGWCQSCNVKYFQQNFKNWTSGNPDVDKLIRESQLNAKHRLEKLEWIEYDGFENIEYITEGSFGTIYKATWKDGNINYWFNDQWHRYGHTNVALKNLNNSKNIILESLNEMKLLLKMNNSPNIIKFYGITKDTKTSNFMMVMENGEKDLRQGLNINFNSLRWWNKLSILKDIACGLSDIHKEGLTHRDFHSGNILNIDFPCITDLGLNKPVNEKSNNKVYGVLPYVAPEVLRGKKYTQESDVYGFGIIMYEIFNGLPPHYDIAHEEFLAIKICNGLRPKFNIKVPQLIDDIAKQCVDAVPSKRPTAECLHERFYQWYDSIMINKKDSEIYEQIIEANEFNKKQSSSVNTELIYTTHPQAIYTSRLLNFNNLPEPKNADDKDEY